MGYLLLSFKKEFQKKCGAVAPFLRVREKSILRKWRPIVKTCKKFSDDEKGYDEVA